MDVLDAGDELVGKQEDRLQGKFAVTKVEEIFQTGTEEVENHGIVVTLSSEPADEGNSNAASKGLVHTSLILKLRVLGLDRLELNGNLLSRDNVGSKVDVAKRTRADLSANPVFITDAKVLSNAKTG